MSEKFEFKNPIEIKDNSKERVAFDLMEKIATKEYGSSVAPNKEIASQQKSREYWFKLYNQSYQVVNNKDINITKLLED